MGLPSQRSDDDSALVDEITRSIDGAGDAKKVRSLLNAWWRYAGVRAAAGAEVDAEKFLAERSALGLLELPVATSRAVIELEYAIANGPQGPLPVVVAPELTPVSERPIAVVPPPAPEPDPEPDVEDEPVAELADEATDVDVEDEPAEVEEPVAELEFESEPEPEAEIELEPEAEVERDDDEVEVAEEPVAELELDDDEQLADVEPVAGSGVTEEIALEDDAADVDEQPAAAGPAPAPGFEAEFGNVPSPAAEPDEGLPQEFEGGDPAAAPLALVPEPEVEPEPAAQPEVEHEPEVVSAPEAYRGELEDGSAPEVEQDEPEAAFEPEVGFEAEDGEREADADPEPEQRFVMLPIAGFTPEPELLDELGREAAAEQEVVPQPAAEPEPTADDDAAPIAVAALLADAGDAELPEDWQSLDAPVPITQFDRFRHDRAERTVENAERAKVAVYAGLIVFFAVVIGVAMAASLAITHIPVPGGEAASIIEPWRAWLAIVTGVAGVVVATLIARRHGLQMFGPRIGLGGLALTGLGLLAGSVIAAAAGGIVLLGGAALGAVRRA